MPSIGQNLQPFIGNGDVSVWVKNSPVGRKNTNKQIKIKLNQSKFKSEVLCAHDLRWENVVFWGGAALSYYSLKNSGTVFENDKYIS